MTAGDWPDGFLPKGHQIDHPGAWTTVLTSKIAMHYVMSQLLISEPIEVVQKRLNAKKRAILQLETLASKEKLVLHEMQHSYDDLAKNGILPVKKSLLSKQT